MAEVVEILDDEKQEEEGEPEEQEKLNEGNAMGLDQHSLLNPTAWSKLQRVWNDAAKPQWREDNEWRMQLMQSVGEVRLERWRQLLRTNDATLSGQETRWVTYPINGGLSLMTN